MKSFFAAAVLAVMGALPAAAVAQAAELPGAAQLKGLLGSVFGPAASAPAGPARAAPTPSQGPAGLDKLAEIVPNQSALNELKVDRECLRVQERFDVFEKLAEYGGTNAQLRLQALIASDMAHSDLSDSDRRMLRYLAYTTVWVPASVETAAGKLWAAVSSSGDDSKPGAGGRTQRAALARLAARLDELHGKIDGFPGKVSLVLDPKLGDGAFARVGGMVVLSESFLAKVDENDTQRDVLLSHELAHLYKRHTIKELQYQLISNAQGWQLAKKLLGKAVPSGGGFGGGNPFSMLGTAIDSLTMAKQVFDAVQALQQGYSTEQELEADACAMKWLQAGGLEPRTAWRTFAELLEPQKGQATTEQSYIRLHPSPEDRTRNIDAAFKPVRPTAPPSANAPAARAPARAASRSRP